MICDIYNENTKEDYKWNTPDNSRNTPYQNGCFCRGGGGKQFMNVANSYFYRISGGMDELPIEPGQVGLDMLAFFWFFYFGLLLIPLGLLVHSIEWRKGVLPYSFTVSYLIFIIIGCYMLPNSGMTVLMLPQAVYMLVINHIRIRKNKSEATR